MEDCPGNHSEDSADSIEDYVSGRAVVFVSKTLNSRANVSSCKAKEGLAEEVNTEGLLQMTLELESADALGKHVHSTVLKAPSHVHKEGEGQRELVVDDVYKGYSKGDEQLNYV